MGQAFAATIARIGEGIKMCHTDHSREQCRLWKAVQRYDRKSLLAAIAWEEKEKEVVVPCINVSSIEQSRQSIGRGGGSERSQISRTCCNNGRIICGCISTSLSFGTNFRKNPSIVMSESRLPSAT